MTRYLVVEVVDEIHDLTDMVTAMREGGINGRASLMAGGYNLSVRLLPRGLVEKVTGDKARSQVYMEEGW